MNRVVAAYLEFAELQALTRKPMSMAAWIAKLDDFLRLSDRNILDHAGAVSHQAMLDKVEAEYQRYQKKQRDELSQVEKDMIALDKKIRITREKPHG